MGALSQFQRHNTSFSMLLLCVSGIFSQNILCPHQIFSFVSRGTLGAEHQEKTGIDAVQSICL